MDYLTKEDIVETIMYAIDSFADTLVDKKPDLALIRITIRPDEIIVAKKTTQNLDKKLGFEITFN